MVCTQVCYFIFLTHRFVRVNRYLLVHEIEVTSTSSSTGEITIALNNNSQTIQPSSDITFYEISTDPDILVYNGSQNAPEGSFLNGSFIYDYRGWIAIGHRILHNPDCARKY